MTQDPYHLHRPALAPLLPGATKQDLERAITIVNASGEEQFAQFLCQQGLAPLWDEQLEHYKGPVSLSPEYRDLLHQSRLHTTGTYLLQRHQLENIKEILDTVELIHIVYKGSHTREVYYTIPALRPAVDIDVLVRPEDKVTAIKALQIEGFEFYGVPENISHECTLVKGDTTIDLHWNILRPGRTRQPMIEELLASRVNYGSHWGMSHSANLFLMLVHPVFTKYSTTLIASLSRLVDMAKLLDKNLADQAETIHLLNMAGLATAGWITAHWFHMLTESELCTDLADQLKPGKLRQQYLGNWLRNDRSSRLLEKPLRIQLGFTLPAHDRPDDALRALWRARQCRREGPAMLTKLEEQFGLAEFS